MPKVKLTLDDIELIKLLHSKGLSMAKLAKKFTVSRLTISKVLNGKYPVNKDDVYDGR